MLCLCLAQTVVQFYLCGLGTLNLAISILKIGLFS